MPFVRITRDRRGYENTFVVHTTRMQGRKRSRVLYWFRTPPGIRVGRAPLDAEAIRAIEDSHPDIRFDWPTMLKQSVVSEMPRTPRITTREEEEIVDQDLPGSAPDEEAAPRVSALEELVGAEGVVRLRARFAELRARIDEERAAADPVPTLDDIVVEAEALDPDTWVTMDEARRGLETFEGAYEALQRKLPRARGRSRERGRAASSPPPENPTQSAGPPSAETPEKTDDRGSSGDV